MGLDIGFNGIRYMLPLFGLPCDPDKWIYIDDDKKVQFLATQDGFRDCMEWLHMLYEEGLVDPEIVSQDFNTVETKLKEGNVGFFTAWRLLAMAYDDGVASNSVLWTPDSSASLYRYLELCKPGAFVTSTNQNVPATMRWLDACWIRKPCSPFITEKRMPEKALAGYMMKTVKSPSPMTAART